MSVPDRSSRAPRVQYAALPFRRTSDGGIEVLLVTSRGTRRWIIPKGWPVSGLTPSGSAAREAFEEAGVIGPIGETAVGTFRYQKQLNSGAFVTCEATIFPLEVQEQRRRFPEASQREQRWFSPQAAAEAVAEEELGRAIRAFAESQETRSTSFG
jgi:ADP-ribose pyrophosphatase YjhB (NUDIX family)